MVSNISGQGKFSLSSLIARSSIEQLSTPSPNNLLGNNKLVGDIEKHIDDYQKGKGNLSQKTGKKISRQQISSGIDLANINPSLSRLYNGYSTGLSYSKNARFVSGIHQSINTTRRLLDLYS